MISGFQWAPRGYLVGAGGKNARETGQRSCAIPISTPFCCSLQVRRATCRRCKLLQTTAWLALYLLPPAKIPDVSLASRSNCCSFRSFSMQKKMSSEGSVQCHCDITKGQTLRDTSSESSFAFHTYDLEEVLLFFVKSKLELHFQS